MTVNRNSETFADAGEEKIAGLLGSLPPVSAPSDFDFRVRARIAKGRPAIRPSWAMRIGRVAVPTALLVGIGGYFGTGMFTQQGTSQIDRAGMIPTLPIASQPAPVEPTRPVGTEAPVQPQPHQQQPEVAKNLTKPTVQANAVAPANKKVEAAPKPTQSAPMSYEEAGAPTTSIDVSAIKKLGDAGVKLSNRRVVSAPAGSGFQAGDQILDMSSSSVTVRRDGKTVRIALK